MNKSRSADVPRLVGLQFVAAFSALIVHSAPVLMQGHERPGGVASERHRQNSGTHGLDGLNGIESETTVQRDRGCTTM